MKEPTNSSDTIDSDPERPTFERQELRERAIPYSLALVSAVLLLTLGSEHDASTAENIARTLSRCAFLFACLSLGWKKQVKYRNAKHIERRPIDLVDAGVGGLVLFLVVFSYW